MKTRWSVLSALIVILSLAGQPVLADDVYWVGNGEDQYLDMTSWSPRVPQAGDNVFLDSSSSTIICDGSVELPELNSLDVNGVSVNFEDTFELIADTFSVRDGGNVWQYGGSVDVVDMIIGAKESSQSEYHIYGEVNLPAGHGWEPDPEDVFLGVHNNLVITKGWEGGRFFQNGGIVFVKNDLLLTADEFIDEADSGYMLNDGVLWTKNTILEGGGWRFVQNDGMHFVGVDPTIEDFPLVGEGMENPEMHQLLVGANSFYEMSGGELYVDSEIVNGGFGHGGGKHFVYRDLAVGIGQGVKATYGLESLAELHVRGDVFVGRDGGTGTAYFWGGLFQTDGELVVGSSSASGVPGAQGYIDQAFHYAPSPEIQAQRLVLGRDIETSGMYSLAGGSLSADSATVGQLGRGEFVQSGGAATFAKGGLVLGAEESGFGEYRLSGGDLVVHGPVHVGQGGPAVFEQTGGTHRTGNVLNIGGYGEYRMQGGVLEAQEVVNNNVFTYSGGEFAVAGEFRNEGTFQGAGDMTVGTFVNNGLLTPGNSPGTLGILGDFVQGADGRLNIGLGPDSLVPLEIFGQATLDGVLNISLLDGYFPEPGSAFNILAASSLSGDFARIVGPQGWMWTASIEPGILNGAEVQFMRFATSTVPLPGAALLFGSGLLGLVGLRRRQIV